MNKTSKIKEVNEVKEWGSGEKLTYYHNITLENGDKINIGFKDKKAVGTELNYEIVEEVGQHEFTKAKTPQKEFTKGGYSVDQDAILYQVILKGVMNFYTDNFDNNIKDHENLFTSDSINKLTLEIAQGAKKGISTLKQSN